MANNLLFVASILYWYIQSIVGTSEHNFPLTAFIWSRFCKEPYLACKLSNGMTDRAHRRLVIKISLIKKNIIVTITLNILAACMELVSTYIKFDGRMSFTKRIVLLKAEAWYSSLVGLNKYNSRTEGFRNAYILFFPLYVYKSVT